MNWETAARIAIEALTIKPTVFKTAQRKAAAKKLKGLILKKGEFLYIEN